MRRTAAATWLRGWLGWLVALGRGLLHMAVIMPLAVGINVWLGRTLHWDIIALISVVGVAGLTLVQRRFR